MCRSFCGCAGSADLHLSRRCSRARGHRPSSRVTTAPASTPPTRRTSSAPSSACTRQASSRATASGSPRCSTSSCASRRPSAPVWGRPTGKGVKALPRPPRTSRVGIQNACRSELRRGRSRRSSPTRATRPIARRLRETRGVSSCERHSEALRKPPLGRAPLTLRANRTRFVPSNCKHLGCRKRANGGPGGGPSGRNPCKSLVGARGFEPRTSSLSGRLYRLPI